MPRMCCVSGCTSNYRSEKQEKVITTFALPKDEDLKKQWLEKIPTDLSNLKKPVICLKHFPESTIIRSDMCRVKGEMVEFPRKIPKLKEGTVPSIFENVPRCLTSDEVPSASTLLMDVELDRTEEPMRESLISKENKSLSFEDIKKRVCDRPKWVYISENNLCTLCYVETKNVPVIIGSIQISSKFNCKLYLDGKIVSKSLHPNNILIIKDLNDLDALLEYIEARDATSNKILDLNDIINGIESHFEKDNDVKTVVSFICEQLKLLNTPKNNRRYSGSTMVFAACAYMQSSSAYLMLHKSKMLCIPHPRNIKTFINNFSSLGNSLL